MKIKHLIIGTGMTGQSIMQHLHAKHIDFAVFDTRKTLPALNLLQSSYPNATFYLQDPKQIAWDEISKVWVSPGIAPFEEVVRIANEKKLPIGGDLELFAQQNINIPIIAITGTNGKSTLVSLITAILRHLNFNVALAGNIGDPMLHVDPSGLDYCVLELSSFQLYYQQSLKADVACILNISEDHTDWHGSFDAYIEAKQKIYQHAKNCIFNADDINTFPNETKHSIAFSISRKDSATFTFDAKTLCFFKNDTQLFTTSDLKLKGTHNYEDILAALATIDALKIDILQAIEAIQNFDGLPHRTQFVREINGIKWINDSKGTNVGATLAAIKGLSRGQGNGKIIWLAGGIGKGADFTPLKTLVGQEVRHSILFGADRQEIANALNDQSPYTFADDLKSAIAMAQQYSKPNDIVLFSPACASFDMFANYLQRGEIFMAMVHQIS